VAEKSLLGLSILFHGALGILVYRIEVGDSHAATAIQMAEAKKKEAPKAKVDDTPKPPPEPPKRSAKRAAAAEKLAEVPPPSAAPAPLEALPDFGLELGGGIGGLAVAPAPQSVAAAQKGPLTARAAPAAAKRSSAAQAPSTVADECEEPPAKPKPKNVPQPAYTDRAREAGVEGKVRIELTVDETGRVVGVRVLSGLGYGLDEAAVAAAQSASFEPAVRCGKASRATFTISMRFSSS
jgi:protein TonB